MATEISINTTNLAGRRAKALIISVINELINDPDFGLELSPRAKKKLRAAAFSGKRNIPFSEIKKRHL